MVTPAPARKSLPSHYHAHETRAKHQISASGAEAPEADGPPHTPSNDGSRPFSRERGALFGPVGSKGLEKRPGSGEHTPNELEGKSKRAWGTGAKGGGLAEANMRADDAIWIEKMRAKRAGKDVDD